MRKLLALVLLLPLLAQAGTVTGNIQTASSGAVVNGTLTFTLNQFAVVSGTAQVVATGVQCYTSTAGAITGEPDPQTAPVLSVNLGSGTLAAGTYFVKYTYFDGTGESLPSPEASVTLVSPGTVIVAVPAIQPANATGWRVSISAATGTETRQSSQTGFAASYQQTAALAAGTALPGTNTSACSIRFTDELIPSTTYFTINLVNSLGSKIAGYPISQARFYGGTNGSVNVSSGWPVSIGGVIWPSPIVSTPNSNATQSIAGGLNLGTFPFTAGNGTFTSLNVSKVIRDCRTDGMVCNATWNGTTLTGTDDSAALNSCLANAVSGGYGGIQLPAAQCRLNSPINDTNKPSLNVYGATANEAFSTEVTGQNFGTITELMCNTGAVCWDWTGSGRSTIKNVTLATRDLFPTPSTFGILLGRDNAVSGSGWITGTGTYCFSENNVLDNVFVFMESQGAGTTIGVYDVGAEQFTMKGGEIIADKPISFSLSNYAALSSPFQTLQTGCPGSMTEVEIMNGATFQAITKTAVDLHGIRNIFMSPDTEIKNPAIGANHSAAITISNDTNISSNIEGWGQIENFDLAMDLKGSVDRMYVRSLAASQAAVGTSGLLLIEAGVNVASSIIGFYQVNGNTQPTFNASSGLSTITDSMIFEGTSSGSGTASNITVTGSQIYATGMADAAVNTFHSGSSYDLKDSSGNSIRGGITIVGGISSPVGIGSAETPGDALLIDPFATLTGGTQIGLQIVPTTSSAATGGGEGMRVQMNTPASAFTQPLNVGVRVMTPTVGAGSVLTEWDGLRVESAPVAGTKCSLSLQGSTSGATCLNPPATGGAGNTLPSTAGTLTVTVGSGTAVMTTAGIATGACGTTVTVGATGVATTDTINISRNAAVTIGNGGGLTLNAWPTANNVNFNYCNSAAGTITPTAMTINWNVTR